MKAQVQDLEATCAGCRLVPLTILALDVDEPVVGWSAFFRARGVEIVLDDIGRRSVLRADARALLEERQEWERRTAEENRRRQEEAAREFRPARGIPRPANADAALTAFEVMRGADAEAEEADPRRRISPREEFLMTALGRPQKVVTEEE